MNIEQLANKYGVTGKFQQTSTGTTVDGKCRLSVSGGISEVRNMEQFASCCLLTLGWMIDSLWLVLGIKEFIIAYISWYNV